MNYNFTHHTDHMKSLSNSRLHICVLAFFITNVAIANNPAIEKRSLSTNKLTNSTSVANTSTEWQLYQKILELDEEITQLRDKVERMEGAVEKAQKSQADFQSSIEQRLNNQEDAIIEVVDKLESEEPKADSESNIHETEANDNNSDKNHLNKAKTSANTTVTQKSGRNNKTDEQLTTKNNRLNYNNTDTNNTNAEEEAKKAYLSAYSVFKKQGKTAGVANMTKFINFYPNSKLVPSAYFWIGEFYLSGSKPDFFNAKNSFVTVIQKYPNSQKVPKSLYRLGYIAKISKRDDIAKSYMREILSKHPSSREAGLAKAFLDRYIN